MEPDVGSLRTCRKWCWKWCDGVEVCCTRQYHHNTASLPVASCWSKCIPWSWYHLYHRS
jgi:hypothetical protein